MADYESKIYKVPLSEQLYGRGGSAFARYKMKAAGELSFLRLIFYECFTLFFANLGGALGYIVRKSAARYLFRSVGPGLILGRGLILRHPSRITLGASVAVDDYVFLDASGSGTSEMHLGDRVILSRNCVVQAKTGPVTIGERVEVGCNCLFSSVGGITIGAATLIAGNCYFGGGRYYHARLDLPIMDQGGYSRGPLVVGAKSWIGAGAILLDGVKLGEGVIVGAGSVVTKDVPDYAVVAGVPARVLRIRGENDDNRGTMTDEIL